MTLRRPRLIPRLAVKGSNVIVTVNLEGLRVVGKPADLARRYAQDADELLYLDSVASLYGRNQLTSLLEETTDDTFIPITVGGGIKSRADAKRLFDAGADKIALNTAAILRPESIRDISGYYGSQAVVVSIEAKRVNGGWEAYTENGRQRTGKDAVAWAFEAVRLGAGELLITSVDREGTRRGCDLDLIRAIAPNVPVPVIACGGIGSVEDVRAVAELGACAALSSALHSGALTVGGIRQELDASIRPGGEHVLSNCNDGKQLQG
ncbi:MAG: imidazole glycerol phosphate synthase cyclase subunit [Sulfuricaulis sp.]|nr:imidazole glycerol phosphate synthase cyclase subunit [Sulfuricaulis sp.]